MDQCQNWSIRTQVRDVTVHFRPRGSLGHIMTQPLTLVERLRPFRCGGHGEYFLQGELSLGPWGVDITTSRNEQIYSKNGRKYYILYVGE